MARHYQVGDIVHYQLRNGSERSCTVKNRRFHQGAPIFVGTFLDQEGEERVCWGYDTQIIQVCDPEEGLLPATVDSARALTSV